MLVNGLLAQRPPGRGGSLAGPSKRTPLERWMQLSPEQRERALKELPPERRKVFQERMDRFNRLPKEEQERRT